MNVRTVCLALLAHGEASGYDLKTRWTDGPFLHFVDASFGSIYPALAKLRSEGLVSLREENQPGKPPRKVYALTEAGKAAFIEAMSQPPGEDIFRSSFAMIALCAPFLDREVIARAVDTRIAQQKAELAELEQALEAKCGGPIDWLLDWGVTHFRNDIAHVEATRKALEDMAGGTEPGTEVALPVRACQAEMTEQA